MKNNPSFKLLAVTAACVVVFGGYLWMRPAPSAVAGEFNRPKAETAERKDEIPPKVTPASSEKAVPPKTQAGEAPAGILPPTAELMKEKTIGHPSALVILTVFSSPTCSHCARFFREYLPKLIPEYVDTKKMRIVFYDLPPEQSSVAVSQLSHCVPMDKFVEVKNVVYERMDEWYGSRNIYPLLVKYGAEAGIPEEVVRACMTNPELSAAIAKESLEKSAQYRIEAVPSFLFQKGVRKPFLFRGLRDYDSFKAMLDGVISGDGKPPAGAEEIF